LANTASAIKRVRSNNRKRLRNRINRTTARTAVKSARAAQSGANAAEARAATLAAISALDKAAQKGAIHKGNAARRKSRLMKKLAELEAKK
jgi:small subunit ribosomal protein S20